MAVKIDGLADAVADALREYREETTEEIKASVRSSAKACVAELQANSPEDTGAYKKGWRVKTAYEDDTDIRLQVHNATNYQLTHLLEDGHANVSGGRTPAHPHIASAADNASQILEKDINIKVGSK